MIAFASLRRWELPALLDGLLPLSLLGVGFERSEDPFWMIGCLTLWCGLKLALQLRDSPLAGVLLGVLLVNLSAVLHPLSVSSPSDLTLVLLAVGAGLGQSARCWRQSVWVLLLLVPLSVPLLSWSRINENLALIPFDALREVLPQEAARLGRITINRSAYLWGLLSVLGYGVSRLSQCRWQRLLALVAAVVALALAFATGSRAALALPLIIVPTIELAWWWRESLARHAGAWASALLALALLVMVGMWWPSSPGPLDPSDPVDLNRASDLGRARVARCFLAQSLRDPVQLLGGAGFDRISDRCRTLVTPSLPAIKQGPPHAHNVGLQLLADQGLLAFLMAVAAVWLTLRRLLRALPWVDGPLARVGLGVVLFMLGFGLIESTLLKTSLQQVITGYLLALAWMPAAGRSKDNARSIDS